MTSPHAHTTRAVQRHAGYMRDRQRAKRAIIVHRFALPLRAAKRGVSRFLAMLGVKSAAMAPDAPAVLPPRCDPRDAQNHRLVTVLRPQGPGDQNCYAYATAAAMEAWLCRSRNTTQGVPYMSLVSLDTGNDSLFSTAQHAERGISEDGNPAVRWKLTWAQIEGDMDARPPQMQRALVDGSPIAISIPVYQSFLDFRDATETQVYAPVRGEAQLSDAHALSIIGYDTPRSAWIVKNSDPKWGNSGYGMIRALHPSLEAELVLLQINAVNRL